MEKIEEKEYRIVIGDLVEDIHMMGEYPEDTGPSRRG